MFFQTAMKLVQKHGTPAVIRDAVGGNVSRADAMAGYMGDVQLHCNGKYLSQAYMCIGKDGDGFPTDFITCPETVVGGNCPTVINVPAFPKRNS